MDTMSALGIAVQRARVFAEKQHALADRLMANGVQGPLSEEDISILINTLRDSARTMEAACNLSLEKERDGR